MSNNWILTENQIKTIGILTIKQAIDEYIKWQHEKNGLKRRYFLSAESFLFPKTTPQKEHTKLILEMANINVRDYKNILNKALQESNTLPSKFSLL